MGHASALTLRVDFLVPSRVLNSVVILVYSLVPLGAVRLEPKWRRYRVYYSYLCKCDLIVSVIVISSVRF